MTEKQILQLFDKSQARLNGHFVLASGRHSSEYMQCAKLFMYPKISKKVCRALFSKLKNIDIDFVASPAVGGVIMGYEMAAIANKPNIFFERIDGKMTLRRGFSVERGKKYLVVEDVVTTGGSVKEVCAEIEKSGGIVAAVASVVDRSSGSAAFSAPYYSLIKVDIKTYDKENCPLCAENLPVTKPGTRALSQK